MTPNRIAAGTLSILLLLLLGWSIFSGIGDLRTQFIIALGVVLGSLYTAFGRLPGWIVDHSGGSITDDADPSNISPRVYMPIVFGALLVAVIAFCVVLFIM